MDSVVLDLISMPFGSLALYYGYRGYTQTRGGLRALPYFLLAMTGMGIVILVDILRLTGLMPPRLLFMQQFFHAAVAIFFMLAFRDLHSFLSNT